MFHGERHGESIIIIIIGEIPMSWEAFGNGASGGGRPHSLGTESFIGNKSRSSPHPRH